MDELRDLAEKRWGKGYFEELEKFLKEHEKADAIEYHNEIGCPTKAIYYFRPYTVVVDDARMLAALREAADKLKENL